MANELLDTNTAATKVPTFVINFADLLIMMPLQSKNKV